MTEIYGIPEKVFLEQAMQLSKANPELTFEEVWHLWKSQVIKSDAMEEDFEEDYDYADGRSVDVPKGKKTWAEVVAGPLKKN